MSFDVAFAGGGQPADASPCTMGLARTPSATMADKRFKLRTLRMVDDSSIRPGEPESRKRR